MSMTKIEQGDRVYYTEHGPDDTGTVISVSTDELDAHSPIYVKWDDDSVDDWYSPEQLALVSKA